MSHDCSFFSEMWYVYGYVSVPIEDIKAALASIAPYTTRWVDPYGGTGMGLACITHRSTDHNPLIPF